MSTPAELLTRLESVPFSRWHLRARVIMGSAYALELSRLAATLTGVSGN